MPFLRGLVDADRAFTVAVTGTPDDPAMRVGIEHVAVAAVETLLLSGLFLVVDVAESAWSLEVEDRLLH